MSRLNAIIKIVVFLGEAFFLLLGLAFVLTSGITLTGRAVALNFKAARQTAMTVLIFSLAVLGCACCGCCGAVNQVRRRGKPGGCSAHGNLFTSKKYLRCTSISPSVDPLRSPPVFLSRKKGVAPGGESYLFIRPC